MRGTISLHIDNRKVAETRYSSKTARDRIINGWCDVFDMGKHDPKRDVHINIKPESYPEQKTDPYNSRYSREAVYKKADFTEPKLNKEDGKFKSAALLEYRSGTDINEALFKFIKMGANRRHVSYLENAYGKKISMRGAKKFVVNRYTHEIFDSVKSAAKDSRIPYQNLVRMLNGRAKKNTSPFEYYKGA